MKTIWHEILIELVSHTIETSQAATTSDFGAIDVQVIRGHVASPKSVKRQSQY